MNVPAPESDPNRQLVVSLEAAETDKGRPLAEQEWVDIAKEGIRQDDLFIRIESAKTGRLPERGTASFLLVHFRIDAARQGRKITYQRYLPGQNEPKLTDNSGRSYAFLGDRIRKTPTKFHLMLKVDQILVFEPPAEGVEFLKLELPASASAQVGVCRFRIADFGAESTPVAARSDEEHVQALPARAVAALTVPDLSASITQLGLLQNFTYASSPIGRQIAETKALILRKPEVEPDPALGRALFVKTCQECHTLYGVGREDRARPHQV